jgi:hypothetical protein
MKTLKELFEQMFNRDRRRANRQPASELSAFYWTGAAPAQHRIRDISPTGLYLVTEERWYPGTLIMMTLQNARAAEESPERSISVQSKAVRWGADGVGLEFILLDTRDPRRGQNVLKEGVDRKSLERFLQGFNAESGCAVVDGVRVPPRPLSDDDIAKS